MTQPQIDRVEVLEVRPNDVVVFRMERGASMTQLAYANKQLAALFPDNRTVVLMGDDKFEIVRPED